MFVVEQEQAGNGIGVIEEIVSRPFGQDVRKPITVRVVPPSVNGIDPGDFPRVLVERVRMRQIGLARGPRLPVEPAP